jgi:uncharacterized membrane protein HdeD (DUF308 family)
MSVFANRNPFNSSGRKSYEARNNMAAVRRIFGVATLIFGIALLIATFAYRIPALAVLRTENATGFTFLLTAINAMPFIATYTKLGLNSAEGEKPSPEVKARHARLNRECRIWPTAWYGGLGFIGFVWTTNAAFGFPVHPFFAFSGVVSVLTGVWFLFAYPIAGRLVDQPNQ